MSPLKTDDVAGSWDPMWRGARRGAAWIAYANGHPASHVVGLRAVDDEEDGMTFAMEDVPAPNPNGSVHGGLLAAALDNVLAFTAMTGMPEDAMPNTAAMGVRYLRPAMAPLEIRSRVRRGGRSLVFVEAEVFSGGKLCATADGTFAVRTVGQVSARDA